MLPQRAVAGKPAGDDTMARFKHIDTKPQFITIDLQAQPLPGTFAFALNDLVDLDLSALAACCTPLIRQPLSLATAMDGGNVGSPPGAGSTR